MRRGAWSSTSNRSMLRALLAAVLALAVASAGAAELASGVDRKYVDNAVRPQDDFYRSVNGKWLDTFVMPADKARYGAFDKLRDDTELQVKALVEDAARATDAAPGSETQKIRDLYNSFMDEAKLEELGAKPLAPLFARIDAVKDKADVAALIATLQRPAHRRAVLASRAPGQSRFHQVRRRLAPGRAGPARSRLLPRRQVQGCARAILRACQEDARHGRRPRRRQDRAATSSRSNPNWPARNGRASTIATRSRPTTSTTSRSLAELAPGVDWKRWLADSGDRFARRLPDRRAAQLPDRASRSCSRTRRCRCGRPISNGSCWTRRRRTWRRLTSTSSSPSTTRCCAAFRRTARAGSAAWSSSTRRSAKRWASSTSRATFRRRTRRAWKRWSRNLLAAYRQSIDTLDWMSRETKTEAQAKLAKFTVEDRLSRRVARLLGPRRRQGRPRRQLDAGAGLRVPAQHRQAGQADRPQRMGHDAADGQRLLQPRDATRSSFPRRSCSRRSST